MARGINQADSKIHGGMIFTVQTQSHTKPKMILGGQLQGSLCPSHIKYASSNLSKNL